jgi:hypothetical protein
MFQLTPGMDLTVQNCGCGRQSTCEVLMAVEGLTPRPNLVIFSDTGWERKQSLRYWEQIIVPACERVGIPVMMTAAPYHRTTKGKFVGQLRTSGKGIRDDVLRSVREGTPVANARFWTDTGKGTGKPLRRICTSEYKVEPITQAIRKHLGIKKGGRAAGVVQVEQWIGIATEERKRATGRSGLTWSTLRYPLLEMGMSTTDCVQMIEDLGYPVPVKSACIGCPYRSDASWAKLQRDDPATFEDACDFDEKMRHPFGMGRLNDGRSEADYLAGGAVRETMTGALYPAYLHKSCRPLREIDFSHIDPDGDENFGGDFC